MWEASCHHASRTPLPMSLSRNPTMHTGSNLFRHTPIESGKVLSKGYSSSSSPMESGTNSSSVGVHGWTLDRDCDFSIDPSTLFQSVDPIIMSRTRRRSSDEHKFEGMQQPEPQAGGCSCIGTCVGRKFTLRFKDTNILVRLFKKMSKHSPRSSGRVFPHDTINRHQDHEWVGQKHFLWTFTIHFLMACVYAIASYQCFARCMTCLSFALLALLLLLRVHMISNCGANICLRQSLTLLLILYTWAWIEVMDLFFDVQNMYGLAIVCPAWAICCNMRPTIVLLVGTISAGLVFYLPSLSPSLRDLFLTMDCPASQYPAGSLIIHQMLVVTGMFYLQRQWGQRALSRSLQLHEEARVNLVGDREELAVWNRHLQQKEVFLKDLEDQMNDSSYGGTTWHPDNDTQPGTHRTHATHDTQHTTGTDTEIINESDLLSSVRRTNGALSSHYTPWPSATVRSESDLAKIRKCQAATLPPPSLTCPNLPALL